MLDGDCSAGTGTRPVAVDLFAGAGGLSLGLEQAGFDVALAAEFDPIHALTHRFNFPKTPVICRDLGAGSVGEVASLIRENLAPNEAVIDAVVGGPPCQGFSVGGVRNQDDERNGLLLRFVDLVIELQPRVFCLENVVGLLEPRFESLRDEVVRRLASGGFEVGPMRPVIATDFGVPQMRRRVLIMGSRDGVPVPSLQPLEGDSVYVRDALAGLPDIATYRALLKTDSVALSGEHHEQLISAPSEYARRLAGVARDPLDRSYARSHNPGILTNSLRTVHAPKSVQRFGRTAQGKVEPISRLFRLSEDGVARTLRAGTGTDRGSHTSPRPIHPVKNRVITVREAARLHGYPDWFRFHGTNWHGHRQVGNSVPPPLAAAAGRALMTSLGLSVERLAAAPLALGDATWLTYNRTEAAAMFG